MKNKEGRKEIAKVLFDLSKYLLTSIAISSIFSEKIRILTSFIALLLAGLLMIIGYKLIVFDRVEE